MTTIAVLGTGRMGSAMAERLHTEGHDVRLWNRTASTAADLAERLGCGAAASPADAVTGADVVIAMLADGISTEHAIASPAVLAALSEESVTLNMATIGTSACATIERAFDEARRVFLDCPVAGSVASVHSSSLIVMASGAREAVARVEPLLKVFSKQVFYLGAVGNGQAMKLSAGLVVHALNSAVAEGLALAELAGIDPSVAYDVLQSSSVGAPYLDYKRAHFLEPDTPTAMALDLSSKDLSLISALADELDLRLPVLRGTSDEVNAARQAGLGDQDMASILRHLLSDPSAVRGSD